MRFSVVVVSALVAAGNLGAQQVSPDEYAARRAALAARAGDGVIVALGAGEPLGFWPAFGQYPRFEYLTGYREAGAALVIVRSGDRTTETLFVQPKNPNLEVWTGIRHGPAGATRMTGMPARNWDDFEPYLDSLIAAGQVVGIVPTTSEGGRWFQDDDELRRELQRKQGGRELRSLASEVDRLRATRTEAELAQLRRAAEISDMAHREVLRLIEPGINEFEIQALFDYTFRRNGADRAGYSPIVASGANSTVLHYNRDDRFLQAGDVIVMDVAAQYQGYTADVTRTAPVSGTFTREQREIYEIVLQTLKSAERAAQPGVAWQAVAQGAAQEIARGLARVGLIEAADATFDCGPGGTQSCPQYSLYYMHGLGHGIGLEAHDPWISHHGGVLVPGLAFTIEPGVYVRANTVEILADTPRNRQIGQRIRQAVQRYANIGVRIEDNYVVTDRGVELITHAPREIADVEAAMREAWTGPLPRNSELVNAYPVGR